MRPELKQPFAPLPTEEPKQKPRAAKRNVETPLREPEHIAHISAVVAYLGDAIERRYPDNRKKQEQEKKRLCPEAFVCNLWMLEPALEQELGLEKSEGTPEQVARVRSLIYALSWRSHGRPDERALIQDAESIKRRAKQAELLVTHEKAVREEGERRYTEDDWKEIVDEAEKIETVVTTPDLAGDRIEPETDSVESALRRAYTDLHHALRAARMREEELYERLPRGQDMIDKQLEGKIRDLPSMLQDAVRRIRDLRQLRDHLYFRRLYPERYFENLKP